MCANMVSKMDKGNNFGIRTMDFIHLHVFLRVSVSQPCELVCCECDKQFFQKVHPLKAQMNNILIGMMPIQHLNMTLILVGH